MRFSRASSIVALFVLCINEAVQSFVNVPPTQPRTFCRGVETRARFIMPTKLFSSQRGEPEETDEQGESVKEFEQPAVKPYVDVSMMRSEEEEKAAGSSSIERVPSKAAEVMPKNLGRIMYSPYIPPQGEAFKENVFPKEPPELITIDAFDILIELNAEIGYFFRDILQEATDYNARLLSPEKHTEAFNRAYKEVNDATPCFGVRDGLTSKEWWRLVTKKTFDYVEINEPFLREELDEWLLDEVFEVLYHDVFMTDEAWCIKDGALEALSYFKKWRDEEGGPRALGILSNYDERLHAILDELDLLEAFDFVLTSREIGSAMPERAAFQVAMARLGVTDPKVCMHISADFWDNIIGASKAGWHGVYIPVTGELDVPKGADPNLVFSMLGDLFCILHLWDREPENRLIMTTKPVLENGVFAYHEKIWGGEDDHPHMVSLPDSDRKKSWEGPDRF